MQDFLMISNIVLFLMLTISVIYIIKLLKQGQNVSRETKSLDEINEEINELESLGEEGMLIESPQEYVQRLKEEKLKMFQSGNPERSKFFKFLKTKKGKEEFTPKEVSSMEEESFEEVEGELNG